MKRAFICSLIVLIMFMTILVACKKEELVPESTETAIRIEFRGLITHIFRTTTDGRAINRSVLLATTQTAQVFHSSRMTLPDSVNLRELKAATGSGINVSLNPSLHLATVEPLDKLTIRVVGSDGTSTDVLQPALNTSSTFAKQVPHLLPVSNNKLKDSELNPDLLDSSKPPDGKTAAAFFVLEGGTLGSIPYNCKPTKFKKDFGNFKVHDFDEWVTLTGTVSKSPVLLISRAGGAATPVHFTNPAVKILIQIENLPSPPETTPMSHFDLFTLLAKTPSKFTTGQNTWDDIEPADCTDHGALPGCSNTQWP